MTQSLGSRLHAAGNPGVDAGLARDGDGCARVLGGDEEGEARAHVEGAVGVAVGQAGLATG